MKCIVGLGNPGKEYEGTRHNIGFMVLDFCIEKNQLEGAWVKKDEVLIFETRIGGERVLMIKPMTFMNRSGEALKKVLDYRNDVEVASDVLIVHDELDIAFGTIKLTHGSSAAGHNGVQDIINHLHTQDFARARLGVGAQKPEGMTGADFVLGRFSPDEEARLGEVLQKASDLLVKWVQEGLESTQRTFNIKE